jgi:ketosteroid isomerase-like protein
MNRTEARQRTNVELVRRAVEAFQRGDLEGILADARQDFEVFLPSSLPNSGKYVGRDQFFAWLWQWLDAWDQFTVEIAAVDPAGERHVVASMRQSGLGKGSGIPVEMDIAYMWEVREGRLAALHLYASREEAVQVAQRREREDAQ